MNQKTMKSDWNKIVELYFEDEDDVETYKIVTTVVEILFRDL